MTSNIGKYESSLGRLTRNLSVKLEDNQVDSSDKIQVVVERVITQFREGLETSQKAKEDFINMCPKNWRNQVVGPLAELAQNHFTEILSGGEPIEEKEDFEFENIPSIEELAKQVEACKKKRDMLLQYIELQDSVLEEDSNDLYLDDL